MALARVVGNCGSLSSVLLPLANTLPIPPRLFAANLLPRFRRAIPTSRVPARPAAGGLSTGVTAIAAQGVHRNETAFTILQQTQTSAGTANAGTLIRGRPGIIMLWAHGSVCSPTVKSRSEALTPLRGVLHDAAPAPTDLSGYHRGDSDSPTRRPCQADTAINTSQPGSHGPLPLVPSFAATHIHRVDWVRQ